MPVLVEFQTLLVRRERLDAAPADVRARVTAAAHRGLEDGALAAFAFQHAGGRSAALLALAEAGLELDSVAQPDEPGEVAVVGQRSGPFGWWPWLELGVVPGPGGPPVLAARLAGDPRQAPTAPEGWVHEGSPTSQVGLCTLPLADRPLRHLRREAGADLYRDRFTGEEVRLARSHPPLGLTVETGAGASHPLQVEVARRWPEIEIGLMFRERLAPDGGMLFRFGAPLAHGFWMKNTLVPLDLLFLDAAGRVVNVVERLAPLTTTRACSAGPVADVLEVPGGWCAAHGVAAGDRVRVGAALGPEVAT